MKNKILALLATVGLVASASAVEINENLSINGFIDGSYQNNEINGDASGIGVDEVELNVLVNSGSVSGALHVDSADLDDLDIEQVHLTYTLDSGLSVTFGRYASALGLEREDPASLHFSRAYVTPGLNLGNVDNQAYEGLAFGYNTGDLGINVSLDQEAGTRDLEGEDLTTKSLSPTPELRICLLHLDIVPTMVTQLLLNPNLLTSMLLTQLVKH